MNGLWAFGIAFAWPALLSLGWLGWQLLRQNGRLLLRLEELEKRLDELEFGGGQEPVGLPIGSDARHLSCRISPASASRSRNTEDNLCCSSSSIPPAGFAGSSCRSWKKRKKEEGRREKGVHACSSSAPATLRQTAPCSSNTTQARQPTTGWEQ